MRPVISMLLAFSVTLPLVGQSVERSRYDLRLERTFAAPPDKVFRCWILPECIEKWFVYRAQATWLRPPTADAVPRGRLDWAVVSSDNPRDMFHFRGAYRVVNPAKRLSFTWHWDSLPIDGVDVPGNTVVTVDFIVQDRATRMLLHQTGLPNRAARDAHEKGWNRCFDGIAALLSPQP